MRCLPTHRHLHAKPLLQSPNGPSWAWSVFYTKAVIANTHGSLLARGLENPATHHTTPTNDTNAQLQAFIMTIVISILFPD